MPPLTCGGAVGVLLDCFLLDLPAAEGTSTPSSPGSSSSLLYSSPRPVDSEDKDGEVSYSNSSEWSTLFSLDIALVFS